MSLDLVGLGKLVLIIIITIIILKWKYKRSETAKCTVNLLRSDQELKVGY